MARTGPHRRHPDDIADRQPRSGAALPLFTRTSPLRRMR
jgi:hypothetical protein